VFSYFAYNLIIHSELPFPELVPYKATLERDRKQPDVVISFRQISNSEAETVDGGQRLLGILETLKECRFLVEFGRNIVIEAGPGIEVDVLRPIILGPIFAVLLRQRGLLVLHASSVVMNGGAIAFMGHSGVGKSTLANAFYQQEYSLVTDDVLAIQVEGSYPIVFPGYPYVRLLPDTAAFLGYDFESLNLIYNGAAKRNHCLTKSFARVPFPLKRIYVLEDVGRSQNEIEAMELQEAFVELTRHSRVTNLLQTQEFVSSHLHQCTNLLKKVPIFRLKRQHSLDKLPDIIELVKKDFTANVSSRSHTLTNGVLG
jgi:hypothetical protein